MSPGKRGPLWVPSAARVRGAKLARFAGQLGAEHDVSSEGYEDFHRWSVENRERFWQEVWSFTDVIGDGPGETILENRNAMPGARWFPGARLNFAENLLREDGSGDAIVFWGEDRVRRRLSRDELRVGVLRVAEALRAAGIGPGDRVAGYLPNIPETVVVALGAVAVGAAWSSCSPDFGAASVLDRFGQIEPSVLFAGDGYFYEGTWHPVEDRAREIADGLSSLERVVRVPYGGESIVPSADGSAPDPSLAGSPPSTTVRDHAPPGAENRGPRSESLARFVEGFDGESFSFERFAFDHPLYILFSSGTTGPPKCIVHGAGGTLLQHLKEHVLHGDVRRGDRVFYFTTCGWMMWNWLVSSLAAGATVLLYDGSPMVGDGSILFDLADEEGMTHLGTSARFLSELESRDVAPRKTHSLESVRVIFSTGSPLLPESFEYVYEHIKGDVRLSSISGGTDIVSCFVLGSPTLPVWRGEIQCRGLGMGVEVFDEAGRSVVDEKGELVCTAPFPSMPLGFWRDPDGERYRAAYFEEYPGVWCHGDYARITPRGGVVIYGRSDTVLNPGGVRIDTAEIYRPVEELDEVLESVVVGQERNGDVRLVLFVRLRSGRELDPPLIRRIRERIRERASPRHVPPVVLDVPDIPRTRSGKIAELAVRAAVHGRPVSNHSALANPESLSHFAGRPELKG